MPRFTQVLFGVSTCCVLVLCVHVFFFLLFLSNGSEISLMNLLGSELYLWHSFVLVTFIIVATTKLWKYEQIHESFFFVLPLLLLLPFSFLSARHKWCTRHGLMNISFLFCFLCSVFIFILFIITPKGKHSRQHFISMHHADRVDKIKFNAIAHYNEHFVRFCPFVCCCCIIIVIVIIVASLSEKTNPNENDWRILFYFVLDK